jgi:hypothetical protein
VLSVQIGGSILANISRSGLNIAEPISLNPEEIPKQLKMYNLSDKMTSSVVEEPLGGRRSPHETPAIADARKACEPTPLTAGETPIAEAAAARDDDATESPALPIILEINFIPQFLKVVNTFHGNLISLLDKKGSEWPQTEKGEEECNLARGTIQQVWDLV